MSSIHRGRIELICGCMFSGKTGHLIERLQSAADQGLRVRAFKHALDVRYDRGVLATHDGRRFPASATTGVHALIDAAASADLIGIDEAQFFGPALPAALLERRARGCAAVLAGIDHDTWGRPFPPLPQIKELADVVLVLRTPCRVCGAPARYSQRIAPVVDGELVGGPEAYEPRCRECFRPLDLPAPPYGPSAAGGMGS